MKPLLFEYVSLLQQKMLHEKGKWFTIRLNKIKKLYNNLINTFELFVFSENGKHAVIVDFLCDR